MRLNYHIQSAQTNRLEAYNRFVAEAQDGIYSLAYAILGSQRAAERATQTAFLQAYKGAVNKKIEPLLFRALLAACQEELRRGEKGPSAAEHPPDGFDGMAWQGLITLPFDLRLAAALVDVAGLDYEQAAELMGIGVKDVRKRLAEARGLLAGRLSRER
jgi:DNA-directed RNA polymerase specialized sigma24 family protein